MSTQEHEAFSGVSGPGRHRQTLSSAQASADLLTPQIYLLNLKGAASARDLPVSPPATDTHPLPARAQVSLDPLSTSWASQLRFHQTVSTPHHVILVPGWGGGRALTERGWVWTLMGVTLSSGLPDASHNIRASSTDLLDSLSVFQEKLPDLCLQEEPEVMWDPGF